MSDLYDSGDRVVVRKTDSIDFEGLSPTLTLLINDEEIVIPSVETAELVLVGLRLALDKLRAERLVEMCGCEAQDKLSTFDGAHIQSCPRAPELR